MCSSDLAALGSDFCDTLIGFGNQAAGGADSDGIEIFVEADAHMLLEQPVNGRLAKAKLVCEKSGGNRFVVGLVQKLHALDKALVGFLWSGRGGSLPFVAGKAEQDLVKLSMKAVPAFI